MGLALTFSISAAVKEAVWLTVVPLREVIPAFFIRDLNHVDRQLQLSLGDVRGVLCPVGSQVFELQAANHLQRDRTCKVGHSAEHRSP